MDWGKICLNDAVVRAERGPRQQRVAEAQRVADAAVVSVTGPRKETFVARIVTALATMGRRRTRLVVLPAQAPAAPRATSPQGGSG